MAGGGPGEPGNRAVGGFRVPPVFAVSAGRKVRRGMRGGLGGFPRSFARRGLSWFAGEAGMGVWGKTWNRAVFLWGRGGSGFSPSAFPDWFPLLLVVSRDVVFPTSTSLLFEGLRSGTWRRRGASASAQAAGGTGPETPRTVPPLAGAVLSSHCAALCGVCAVSGLARRPHVAAALVLGCSISCHPPKWDAWQLSARSAGLTPAIAGIWLLASTTDIIRAASLQR